MFVFFNYNEISNGIFKDKIFFKPLFPKVSELILMCRIVVLVKFCINKAAFPSLHAVKYIITEVLQIFMSTYILISQSRKITLFTFG